MIANSYDAQLGVCPVKTVTASDLEWFGGIPGERLAIALRGAETGGQLAMMQAVWYPGSASPLHYHREGETFFILEGTVVFCLGGDVREVIRGDTVFIPAGVNHSWKNRSTDPVRVLTFFAPGGIETFFTRVGDKSMAEVVTLAAAYGTVVTGQPLDEADMAYFPLSLHSHVRPSARTGRTASWRPASRLWALVRLWGERIRERDVLSRLSEIELRDLRFSQSDIVHEIRKPFWRA